MEELKTYIFYRLLSCLCWCIATFLGTLLPPTADKWNSMKTIGKTVHNVNHVHVPPCALTRYTNKMVNLKVLKRLLRIAKSG